MIDDRLATGMANRFRRELAEANKSLERAAERLSARRKMNPEGLVSAVDEVIERLYQGYVLSKLLVLDKKRSFLEALLISPLEEGSSCEHGAFAVSMVRVSRKDFEIGAMGIRSSFHWLERVFKRRNAYDPGFVREELRAAIIGLFVLNSMEATFREIPSRCGVTAALVKQGRLETITYLTDRQASEEQAERWASTRAAIATALNAASWDEVLTIVSRFNWVGRRRGRTIEIKPRGAPSDTHHQESAIPYDFQERPSGSVFIGLAGAHMGLLCKLVSA